MKRIITIAAIGLVLVILMGYGCSKRNSFITLNEGVKSQWHQVENQYQRRIDLIPNIVKTVEAEANFEKSTLTAVIEARAKATQVTIDANNLTPEAIEKYKEAQGGLSSALGRLMMVTENYPDLKSNQAFGDLRVELEGCENRIAHERDNYNRAAQALNTEIKLIPGSLFAWGFKDAVYFESDKGAEKAPKVDFNIK